ncbi:hypothetical protein GC174_15155 [bacterium]|nr:hypothetical protein [bacterium]
MSEQNMGAGGAGDQVVDKMTEAASSVEQGARDKSLYEATWLMQSNSITTHSDQSQAILDDLTEKGTIGKLVVTEFGDSEKSFAEIERTSKHQSARGLIAEKVYDDFDKIDGGGDSSKQDKVLSPSEMQDYADKIKAPPEPEVTTEMQRDRFSFEPQELAGEVSESVKKDALPGESAESNSSYSFEPDALSSEIKKSLDSRSGLPGDRPPESEIYSFEPDSLRGEVSRSIETDELPGEPARDIETHSFEPDHLKQELQEDLLEPPPSRQEIVEAPSTVEENAALVDQFEKVAQSQSGSEYEEGVEKVNSMLDGADFDPTGDRSRYLAKELEQSGHLGKLVETEFGPTATRLSGDAGDDGQYSKEELEAISQDPEQSNYRRFLAGSVSSNFGDIDSSADDLLDAREIEAWSNKNTSLLKEESPEPEKPEEKPEEQPEQKPEPGKTEGKDPLDAPGGRQFEILEDGSARYKVQSGDTVWHVAEEVLRKRGGADPSNADILDMTNKISKASGLTENGRNPDLIYPYGGPSPVNSMGDTLVIPPAEVKEEKPESEAQTEKKEPEKTEGENPPEREVVPGSNPETNPEVNPERNSSPENSQSNPEPSSHEISAIEVLQLDKYAWDPSKEPDQAKALASIETMTETDSNGNLIMRLGLANRIVDNPSVPQETLQKLVNLSVLMDVDYPLPNDPSTKTSLSRELVSANGNSYEFSKEFLDKMASSDNPRLLAEQKQAIKLVADNMPLYTDGDTISLRQIRAFTGVDREFLGKAKDESSFSQEERDAMNFFSDSFDYFSPKDERLELHELVAYVQRLMNDNKLQAPEQKSPTPEPSEELPGKS